MASNTSNAQACMQAITCISTFQVLSQRNQSIQVLRTDHTFTELKTEIVQDC